MRRVLLLILAFAGGVLFTQFRFQQADERLFSSVLSLVSQRYVDAIPAESLLVKASKGLVEELGDPYAHLYTKDELEDYAQSHLGHYGGVGMIIEDRDGRATVVQVYPNTPAQRAGAMTGDVISNVAGQNVHGWSLDKVVGQLRGPVGTTVKVTLSRPGATQQTEMQREEIKIPAVPYELRFDKVGYIPLTSFNETSSDEVEKAIKDLKQQGATSFILDLRGNGGGILDESVEIADLFLPANKTVVTQRERTDTMVYKTTDAFDAYGLPVIVLVDRYTASASEIVAGALQDHGRARIVGERTFGKGVVQSAFRVGNGNAILKITTGKWFTPNGNTIQKSQTADSATVGGVRPDDLLAADTLSTTEKALYEAIKNNRQQFYLALTDAARATDKTPAARREQVYTNLSARGVTLDRAVFDAAGSYIDYLLEVEAASFSGGQAAAKRVSMRRDPVLQKSIDMLKLQATLDTKSASKRP